MSVHPHFGPPIHVQMSVPPSDKLCCVTATLTPEEATDPSAKSPYHWQIFKCRHLVFSAPVLACTVESRAHDQLLVVASRDELETGRLRSRLTKLHLHQGPAGPVSDAIYSACLQYTLKARLSPAWNPVEAYLVQGRDFLVAREPSNAVTLDVNVHGGEGCAWLTLKALRLRHSPLTLAELEVSLPALERFMENPVGELREATIGVPWINVLPSLKRGMVVGVSKRIPPECPYQTFKALRRHWKNLYGYRLPQTGEEPLYVQMFFAPLGCSPYTYPMMCLSLTRPAALRAIDPHAVVSDFLRAVSQSVPAVCGYEVEVGCATLGYATRGLHPAQQLQLQGTPVNLRQEPLAPRAPAPGGCATRCYPRPQPPQPHSPPPPPARGRDTLLSQQSSQTIPLTPLSCPLSLATQPDREGERGFGRMRWEAVPRMPSFGKENTPPQQGAGGAAPARPLYRPVFQPARPVPVARSAPAPMPESPAQPKIKPTFKPIFNPKATVRTPQQKPAPAHRPTAVVRPNNSFDMSASASEGASTVDSSRVTPVFKPTFRPMASGSGRVAPTPNKPIFLSNMKPQARPQAPKQKASKSTAGKSSGKPPSTPRPTAGAPGNVAGGSGPSPAPSPSTAPAKKSAISKRPADSQLPPEFGSAEQARKASIPLLLAWLRSKGVPCRAKDKKAELLEKVLQNLNM